MQYIVVCVEMYLLFLRAINTPDIIEQFGDKYFGSDKLGRCRIAQVPQINKQNVW